MQKLNLNKTKITVRLAKSQDSRFILQIYNENVKKKNFFSKKTISFNEHNEWFKKKIKEKRLFICSYNVRIGYIRYDYIGNKELSISIAIKNKFKRNGFGKLMLQKTLKRKQIKKFNVCAFVKNSNLSSKKFFLDMNFKKINEKKYLMESKIK